MLYLSAALSASPGTAPPRHWHCHIPSPYDRVPTVLRASEDVMADVLDDAARRAQHYLAGLESRPVAPSAAALEALASLERPFPERGAAAEEVLAELDDIGSPATMASAGGRFFGFVIGGSLPVTVAANWLAATWDQNGGLVATSPINAA